MLAPASSKASALASTPAPRLRPQLLQLRLGFCYGLGALHATSALPPASIPAPLLAPQYTPIPTHPAWVRILTPALAPAPAPISALASATALASAALLLAPAPASTFDFVLDATSGLDPSLSNGFPAPSPALAHASTPGPITLKARSES